MKKEMYKQDFCTIYVKGNGLVEKESFKWRKGKRFESSPNTRKYRGLNWKQGHPGISSCAPVLRATHLQKQYWMLKAGITVKMKSNCDSNHDSNDGPLCSNIKRIKWMKVE